MSKRDICRLLGCVCAEDYPACHRCGTPLYEDFIQTGRLEPVFRAYGLALKYVRKVTGKRCAVCHRRYWSGGDDWVCSEKCFTDWLPF